MNICYIKSEGTLLRRRMQRYHIKLAIVIWLIATLMGCASIESSNYMKRMNAIAKINDQTELANIAVEARYLDVRIEAVRKLNDQTVLAKIAVEDKNEKVRIEAVTKITDQGILGQIALKNDFWSVRKKAISMMNDKRILGKVEMDGVGVPLRIVKVGGDGRFIAYDNGTVLDKKTNLMWAAKEEGENNMDPSHIESYCNKYYAGGYTDWRVPYQDELAGLYNAGVRYQDATGIIAISERCTMATVRPEPGLIGVIGIPNFSFMTGENNLCFAGGMAAYRGGLLPVRSIIQSGNDKSTKEPLIFTP